MEVKNYFATDAQGNVLGSAQVYLYLAGTTTLATGLQSVSGASLANPFTSQSNGLVQFKAPDNNYDLRVVKPGREFTIPIQCFDGIALIGQISKVRDVFDYQEFASYKGNADLIHVTKAGLEGFFAPLAGQNYLPNGGVVLQDGSGKLWGRIYSGLVYASWFGVVGDKVTYDTDSLLSFLNYISASGKKGEVNKGYECLITNITFPKNLDIIGTISLRGDGVSAGGLPIDILGDSSFGTLNYSTPGTEGSFNIAAIGKNTKIASLGMFSDVERTQLGGAVVYEDNVDIGYLLTKNIARPWQAQSSSPGVFLKDINLGGYEIDTYIRGLNPVALDGYYIGYGKMYGKHSKSSKTPGHNGILGIALKNGTIVPGDIADSGEHGFRIGGSSVYPGNCDTGICNEGTWIFRRTGGCGFKDNPNLGELTKNFHLGPIIDIDVGLNTTEGNSEGFRADEAVGCSVESITLMTTQFEYSCTVGVLLASGTGWKIGKIIAVQKCRDRILKVLDTLDESKSDLLDCEFGPISGETGGRVPVEFTFQDTETVRKIGNVNVRFGQIKAGTTALVEITGSPIFIGPVTFSGDVVGDASPAILCAANDNYQADITWKGSRYTGRASDAFYGYPMAIGGSQYSPVSGGSKAQIMLRSSGTVGLGQYTAGIGCTRINSTREAVGLSGKITGNTAGRFQYGWTMWGQNTGATSDETKIPIMEVSHAGVVTPGTDLLGSIGAASYRYDFVHAMTVRTHPRTVSNLPSAATAGAGAKAFVTDSSTATFNAIVSGGGSNAVPVFCDGTAWRVG